MLKKQVLNLFSKGLHFYSKRKDLCFLLLFLLLSFCIYGRFVFTGKFAAGGDFPPAVSYAMNFQAAVNNGQWIPRAVIYPREFTFGGGGLDATAPTADAPDFQYYAFLQSALAYPFLVLGIPALVALQLVVFLAFAFSASILYKAGRLMGANRAVAFLSGLSYIISPWLISNFYGRGGISEALGQSALPLLILGYVYAVKSMNKESIAITALSVIMLVLSHNIFFLYGVVMCALLAITSLGVTLSKPVSWLPKYLSSINFQIPVVLGMGVALGMAASSWQWLPSIMTLKQISFAPALGGGLVPADFSDLSGAWGWAKQFVEPWSGNKREVFFHYWLVDDP